MLKWMWTQLCFLFCPLLPIDSSPNPYGAVSSSESIIFNLSGGFMWQWLMRVSIRREEKKRQRWEKKAHANLSDDAISVGNQIMADLNRHRTQNHIRLNSMCMTLHSAFHPHSLSVRLFNVTDLKMFFHITYFWRFMSCAAQMFGGLKI